MGTNLTPSGGGVPNVTNNYTYEVTGEAPLTAPNILANAGRGGELDANGHLVGAYVQPDWFVAYNGADLSNGGKHTYSSSSYGGAAAADNPDVESFLDTYKASDVFSLATAEFFIFNVIAGTGTLNAKASGGTNYPLSIYSEIDPWAATTEGCHIKCKSGAVCIDDSIGELYINGALQASERIILPADGWLNVERVREQSFSTSRSQRNDALRVYATTGSEFLLALPYISAGRLAIAPDLVRGFLPQG